MTVSKVYVSDKRANRQIENLLLNEGIRRDKNLDYTCAAYDEDYNVIATGSCFGNTLRCMAVSHEHQGEGLMNEIVTHLVQYECDRKIYNLFLYTKCNSAKFFGDLGFYEIVRIEDQIVFMENRRNGFSDYLAELSKTKRQPAVVGDGEKVAALVLNDNPFTLGHLYLVEKASNIRLLAFDIDGVMTDGSITYDENGVEYKTFNAKDGHGLAKMAKNGFITAIITG